MRPIDADALEKAIYEWMPKDQSTWMDSTIPPIENLVVSIMMTIQEQPTIDAVPVIRCKDCVNCGTDDCAMHFESDDKVYQWNRADDYCSLGERKEE